jgi:hypothetical protein
MRSIVHYLPILTTVFAAVFGVVVLRHWRQKKGATYLFWWGMGVLVYGLGTLAESLTTLFGWNEAVFRLWYISGALLGGVVLAQGTVYLMLPRKTANILTVILAIYISIAAAFVLLTPIDQALVETYRLSGEVMGWQFVRLFSPLVNLYAFVFLVGGAFWSAWKYWKLSHEMGSRVLGNIFIAVGALLPGIGGSFARAGQVEVLYATELVGLLSIWLGYQIMVSDSKVSVHLNQRLTQWRQA